MNSGRLIQGLLIVGGLVATRGQAIESPLKTASIQAAFTQGQQLAKNADAPYPLAPNAIYHTADTLRLDPKNGDVDAVVIGTPWERVRYQAYIAGIGEEPITAAQAQERARLPDGSVAILIYAHGTQPDDQDFMTKFSNVQLRLAGRSLQPVEARRSGTSEAQYPDTPGEIGVRFAGTITYIFKLNPSQLKASGTFRFTDPTGKTFALPLTLARYR